MTRMKGEQNHQVQNLTNVLNLKRGNLGFDYMKEIVNNRNYDLHQIGKAREQLAEHFNTTTSRAERAIRHTIFRADTEKIGCFNKPQREVLMEIRHLIDTGNYILD